MTFEEVESWIAWYPICEYGFLETSKIIFSERVRYICETECERYGKRW